MQLIYAGGPMLKFEVSFALVQTEDEAGIWTDADFRTVLLEILKIWADSIDGELESVDIIINREQTQ